MKTQAAADPASRALRRRTVMKGVAWTVPVVAVAAPVRAYAASRPCVYTTSQWATRTSSTGATAANGITAAAKINGTTRVDTAWSNMDITTLTNAALPVYSGQKWLQLATGGANASGETITITFPSTVYCVEFYIHDIDTQFVSGSSKYRDYVSVAGFVASTTSQYVTTSGGTATSAGTATSTSSGLEWDYQTSANGLALFSSTSSTGISSFTISYTNTNAGTGSGANANNMQVWVSPLKYSTTPCACGV